MNAKHLRVVGASISSILALGGSVAWALGGYQGAKVSGGGSIKGMVTWSGPRPALAAFPVTKDKEHCGGETQPNGRLVIAEAGGVSNAVVYLVGIAKGKPLDLPEAKLDQKGCRYEPHILIAAAGSQIAISSSDPVLHNVRAYGAAAFNRPFPKAGVSVKEKLRKPGVVRLQCDNGHYWMSAYIHVVEHPYYAITGADGGFELADVPPGAYKLAMWHESWKETGREKDPKTGAVTSIVYAEPIVVEKDVVAKAGEAAKVDFEMTDK